MQKHVRENETTVQTQGPGSTCRQAGKLVKSPQKAVKRRQLKGAPCAACSTLQSAQLRRASIAVTLQI